MLLYYDSYIMIKILEIFDKGTRTRHFYTIESRGSLEIGCSWIRNIIFNFRNFPPKISKNPFMRFYHSLKKYGIKKSQDLVFCGIEFL